MSLAVLANCLQALEWPAEALASNAEAVEQLRPLFLRLPQAAILLMAEMCQQYLERCEQAQTEPDSDLLGPIMEVFEKPQAPDADS